MGSAPMGVELMGGNFKRHQVAVCSAEKKSPRPPLPTSPVPSQDRGKELFKPVTNPTKGGLQVKS